MKSLLITALALVLVAPPQYAVATDKEVNVYSSRKEALIKPLLDKFSAETGIEVNLVTGKDDALITRLRKEGARSPADVLITVDAGRLYRAKQAGLLQPIVDESVINRVPEYLRDSENKWLGISLRARPIFYLKSAVDPSELSTYEALSDKKWAGRICIRSSSNIYNQSLMASVIESDGEDAATLLAEKWVANFARPPVGGDTDQLRAAAAGVCDIAIANTYYFGRLAKANDSDSKEVVDALGIFWPNQDGRGTHVNVSGVGITQSSKNLSAANQLVAFLLTDKAQYWYAEVNNEYPVVDTVKPSNILASWGEFKADKVNLTKLGEHNQLAVKIMDRAGWK